MTPSLPKRPVASPSEDEDDDEGDRSLADVKRVKLERGLRQAYSQPYDEAEEEEKTSDESEEEESEDDEAESKRLEFLDDSANVAAFEAARKQHGRLTGTTSDAGVIKSVTLIDFMCHRHLKVDFGARMNFLVGHNGSGKSAILTGIAVALGGKAAFTGRGQGLKDLIRKGCDKAVISLTMSNQGNEAYKPELYNPNIVIERTIVKSGASTYTFRAERNGKILARKREELTHMCQWFNITIDSPLTILTQDNARSFLQNADHATLYKFFLDGTQLTALANSYLQVNETLDQISSIITLQQNQVPELEARVETLRRQVNASRKVLELKKKSEYILRELAWSYVVTKEKERDAQKSRLEELETKLADIVTETEECKQNVQPATLEMESMEVEVREFDATRKPLEEAKARAKKKHDNARKEIKGMEESSRDLKRQIDESRKEITNLDKRIADKQKAQKADEDPEQSRLRKRHLDLETQLRKLTRDIPFKEDLIRDITAEHEQVSDRLAHVDAELGGISGQINVLQGTLRNLQGQSTDRLSAFGHDLHRVLEEIRRAKWVHSQPIGPLGLHVQLEDMRYKDALHSLLGQNLCTFAVRHPADKATMLKILKDCFARGYRPGTNANGPPPIIQHSGDLFDYGSGDMSRHGDTVLSKLKIDNEHVARILIVANSIESVFLSPTGVTANAEMSRLLDQGMPQCSFITADGFNTSGSVTKGRVSGPYNRWRGNMLFTRDLAMEIESIKRFLAEKQRQKTALLDDRKIMSARVNEVDQKLADAKRKLDLARKGIPSTEMEMEKIQEKLNEQPSNEIDGFEAVKRGVQDELEGHEDSLRAIEEDMGRVQNLIDQLAEQVTKHEAELEEFAPERTRRQVALQVLIERRAQLQSNVKHWTSSRATTETQRNQAAEALLVSESDLVDWTTKAHEYWHERIETDRSSKEMERERTAITKAVIEAEKRQGVVSEEIMPTMEAAEAKLKEITQTIGSLRKLHANLMKALKTRRIWWTETRGVIAVKARTMFILNIQKRGFEGRLDFNHYQERLAVKIYTTGSHSDETPGGQSQSRSKAPKNLSGGERSFSTVSLLLALWDTAMCPIRCLDEWDVFLDHVNRALAAKMLVDGARESYGKQFILITPQDMAGVQTAGPDNRVIRLSDPTRNQGTLGFQSA